MSNLIQLRILAGPSVEAQAHHSEERLAEDAATHLAHALAAVDEYNGDLLYAETYLICRELHLYLEGIAAELDLVKLDGLQHTAAVALETRCGVVNLEAGDKPHVLAGEIAHQDTPHGPVDNIHSRDIARADGKVVTLVMACTVETRQVGGIMAEVGVHLEDILIVVLQCPLEALDIRSAESELAGTLNDEETSGKLIRHQSLYDCSRAVGRAVVDDEDMKLLVELVDSPNDFLDVFLLVISRNDYYAVTCCHL